MKFFRYREAGMILVTGAAGQLGSGLMRFFEMNQIAATGVDRNDFDIVNYEETLDYITNLHPTCVFHCAAYSNVDLAEEEQERCEKINILGTKNIVAACQQISAKIIYISTDYVFNGIYQMPYEVDAKISPLSVYGKTKAEGENLVENYARGFVVRISWLFGGSGKNFVTTMLRLGKETEQLTVVADQIGSPTYVNDLVPVLYEISKTEEYGIYHATNEGYCSWADFAEKIMEYSNLSCKIIPVSSEEYASKAKRPKNSRLSKKSLDEHGFHRLPVWEDALRRYLIEIS